MARMRSKRRLPHSTDHDVRYVTERRNKNGTLRRYWQRPTHKLTALPSDLSWSARATTLNRDADAARGGGYVVEGTVSWVIAKYRESDGYKKLSTSTETIYRRWLNEFEAQWGGLPCDAITRRVAIKLKEKYAGQPSTQKHATTVLYNVMEEARYWGLIQGDNPAARLRIEGSKKRDRVFSSEERWAFLRAARRHRHGDSLRLYFHLCYYTGQRPGDVTQMRWSRYNGETIELVQQKTGKLVAVPCHRNLQRILAVAKVDVNSIFILARPSGKPWQRRALSQITMEVLTGAGVADVQVRDLRRTAVVALAEADCTEAQIAAVTGHAIEKTRQILEIYLPRNVEMARAGIAKWERNGRKSLTR